MIYSFMTPQYAHINEFQGMFLSCKQVYNEALAAIIMAMSKYWNKI
jgi:hypothetical protein